VTKARAPGLTGGPGLSHERGSVGADGFEPPTSCL
jgi:hypothetical protein